MTQAVRVAAASKDDGAKQAIRYRSLDTWRGVACLMVLLFHAAYSQFDALRGSPYTLPKIIFSTIGVMWLGVPIFFVISGYCITAACQSPRTMAAGIGSYFYRRYRRIFPPFWAVLALTALVVPVAAALGGGWLFSDGDHSVPPPSALSGLQWLGNVTLTESWRYTLGGDVQKYLLNPAWSLCYEEQFYLVCGAGLWIARRHFFKAMVAVSAVVTVLMMAALGQRWIVTGFFFDGRWMMFGGGVLVYWLIHRETPGRRATVTRVLIAVSVLCGAAWFVPPTASFLRANLGPGMEGTVALWFTAALVMLHRYDQQIHASRLLAPITWCGTMCYSVLSRTLACRAGNQQVHVAGGGGQMVEYAVLHFAGLPDSISFRGMVLFPVGGEPLPQHICGGRTSPASGGRHE